MNKEELKYKIGNKVMDFNNISQWSLGDIVEIINLQQKGNKWKLQENVKDTQKRTINDLATYFVGKYYGYK